MLQPQLILMLIRIDILWRCDNCSKHSSLVDKVTLDTARAMVKNRKCDISTLPVCSLKNVTGSVRVTFGEVDYYSNWLLVLCAVNLEV